MDKPFAKPYYDQYHSTLPSHYGTLITLVFLLLCVDQILSYIRHAQSKHPGSPVLLIDLHGQSEMPDHILRGTKNSLTMANLISEYGEEVLTGELSLFGQIAKRGYKVCHLTPYSVTPIG